MRLSRSVINNLCVLSLVGSVVEQMIWVPLMDNNGNVRGIKDALTGQRIVLWDGITDPLTDWGARPMRG